MKYLIGLSGTHGTGKSTILQGVADRGLPVDESQLSRTAQRELGWESLSRVSESVDNMWELQHAILAALDHRDQRIVSRRVFTLVERTPADLWAYTALWCKRLGIDTHCDPEALRYRAKCEYLAKNYARFVVVTPDDSISFVQEPNRADLESRIFVEREIDSFLFRGNYPAYVVKSVERKQRISEVERIVASPLIEPPR